MKKQSLILSALLCMALLFSNITAFADTADDKILTLEEAKALALKNDVQYNLQDSYIQDAIENYEEVSEESSKTAVGSRDVAGKAAAAISQKVQTENAASSVRKAVLNKADLKRSSDYEVTNDFYAVIETRNSLKDAKSDLDMQKRDLDTAEVKLLLRIITKDSFSQTESAYTASLAAYNKAALELENSELKLSKSIGEDIDLSKVQLDSTLVIPDITSLDLNKIKEGNLKNNLTYFSAYEQYKLAEYELNLTVEKYDHYLEDMKSISSSVEEKLDNMLYDAQKQFDDAKYTYNERLDDLDETINDQYSSLKDLYANYEDQNDEVLDMRLTVEQNRVKYQMGLIAKAELDNSTASLDKLENQLYATIISMNMQYLNMVQYSLDE